MDKTSRYELTYGNAVWQGRIKLLDEFLAKIDGSVNPSISDTKKQKLIALVTDIAIIVEDAIGTKSFIWGNEELRDMNIADDTVI